jgi:hypothetical protein
MTTPEIHGYYQWSNACGYGVHLSNDGEQAKLIMNDEDSTVTDWLDVVWCVADDDGEWEPIIDPNGYNVPLNHVMRVD